MWCPPPPPLLSNPTKENVDQSAVPALQRMKQTSFPAILSASPDNTPTFSHLTMENVVQSAAPVLQGKTFSPVIPSASCMHNSAFSHLNQENVGTPSLPVLMKETLSGSTRRTATLSNFSYPTRRNLKPLALPMLTREWQILFVASGAVAPLSASLSIERHKALHYIRTKVTVSSYILASRSLAERDTFSQTAKITKKKPLIIRHLTISDPTCSLRPFRDGGQSFRTQGRWFSSAAVGHALQESLDTSRLPTARVRTQ